jgi:hypothetical protein
MKTDYLITPKQARESKIPLPDGYDAFKINYGQLCQLIEETGPYTDFLVLKNLLKWSWINKLERKGYYVNFFEELRTKQSFTLISWNVEHIKIGKELKKKK